MTPTSPEKLGAGGCRPGRAASPRPGTNNTLLLFFISAFNIVLNFGIAVTYPTLMSVGIVLSVPVNAGKPVWLPLST